MAKKKAIATKKAAEKPIKSNQKAISNKEKKEYAFDLFLNTDYNQKKIASIVNVAEKTISGWIKDGNWDELKGAEQITSAKIIRNIYKQIHSLTEDGKNLEADKLIKAAKAIEVLRNRKVTISQVINVFKEFTTFLFKLDADMAKKLVDYQDKYITILVQD